MSSQTTKLTCGHAFHKECIDRWAEENPTCPYCRLAFRPKRKMTNDEMFQMMVYVLAYTYLFFVILMNRYDKL